MAAKKRKMRPAPTQRADGSTIEVDPAWIDEERATTVPPPAERTIEIDGRWLHDGDAGDHEIAEVNPRKLPPPVPSSAQRRRSTRPPEERASRPSRAGDAPRSTKPPVSKRPMPSVFPSKPAPRATLTPTQTGKLPPPLPPASSREPEKP